MKKSIRSVLRENQFIVSVYDTLKQYYYRSLSDETFIKKRIKKKLNREVNLESPTKYNDKLQWLKLNWIDRDATKCADKYEVREFVKERIGEKYLNELYDVYHSIDDIDIDKLPNSFVLKGTHGSGYNIVCKDKTTMDWNKEFKKMRRWMRKNYYWENREWVYKDIVPKVICEKYIEQDDGEELRDYRFFCFNGEPKFITVDFSINNKKNTRRNLYDLEWNLMEQEISYPRELTLKVNKPDKLDEMIKFSKMLSSSFPHARIDFYYIKQEIIFGEITFFHQSGMGKVKPLEFEEEMGNWIQLP
ncbi:glycosyl transferase [Cytobacillus oceanisediminis]|uniref:ATP-grasp fold amidoligase family protein n=1 Tax=Cytobacillus TaxID=2675230 RepID=UPI00203C01D2|nr:ATP-grasp fold amidoligase family protein [Cytobacillus oceanisediminis]MBY0158836.1 glycosyl transferase [Cytobacillus firmus]MCM3391491.1 glycosyl transferase [Cytobacillus oceanisediminis]MCM3529094.1 glycosyl transferase [Cytobacillus oceanisediminis]